MSDEKFEAEDVFAVVDDGPSEPMTVLGHHVMADAAFSWGDLEA
jgi:hypothetical protein